MGDDVARAVCDAFNLEAKQRAWPMRADATLSFTASSLIEALRVWREKADGHAMPSRVDMNPRALKSFLPEVALFDVVYEGGRIRYRARVIGTSLAQTFGDGAGRFIDEAVPSPFRERWEAMMKLALDVGAPVRTTSRIEFREKTYLRAECLYGPLGEPNAPSDAVILVIHVSPYIDDVEDMRASA